MDSFLLIGQSNMAGRGIIGSVLPIETRDMMFMLRNGRWTEMSEPINPDRRVYVKSDNEYRSGVSLAASFADDYVAKFNREIGLIPCAEGGTAISQWQPGEVLFDNAVFQTKLAMRSSNLKGILWHQGENDSHNMEDVEQYAGRFFRMIDEMIRQLSISPTIPIVIGEITETRLEKWPFAKELNDVLNRLANQYPNIAIAKSDYLQIGLDGCHFTGPSYREFGHRYFKAYCELVNQA